jgi:hypothetical protein
MSTGGGELVVSSMFACLAAVSGCTWTEPGSRMQGDHPEPSLSASGMALDSMDGLEIQSIREDGVDPVKTRVDVARYRSRRALRIVNEDGLTTTGSSAGAQAIAIVKSSDFSNGTIEVNVVGLPRSGAPPTTRGFVGLAFHVGENGSRYESIYLRMTNGRSLSQLERNHATQYIEQPDYTWQRLRKEHPGEYESYVDLEPSAWTKIKIVVVGAQAKLYVNGADQPCLIVNDLKLSEKHGRVALWAGSNTEAYFSNLKITPELPRAAGDK